MGKVSLDLCAVPWGLALLITLTLVALFFFHSSTTRGYGHLHEPRYNENSSKTCHSHRPSVQGAQENSHDSLYVLQPWCVLYIFSGVVSGAKHCI